MAFYTRASSSLLRRLCHRGISTTRIVRTAPAVPMEHEVIYTDEHKRLRESLRKLIDNDINPHVEEWEKKERIPAHQIMKLLGSNGFLGATFPVEYGGSDLDLSYSVAIAEELGNVRSSSVTMPVGVQTDMATPSLARFGSDELRRNFLAPAISGDAVVCLGVSEVGSGSDVASIKTTARVSGEDLVINGGKMWITTGAQADWMCLLANTSEGHPHRNKSLIILPMDTKGVTVSRTLDKLGNRASDTAQIFFEDARVPRKNIIGEAGMGFTYQMMQFQRERLWGAASGELATV